MKKIPQYLIDKSLQPPIKNALLEASLSVQPIGLPKITSEGIEQVWKCCDQLGDLFSFGTCELSLNNAFGLKAGAVYLEVGPPARARTRKVVSEALKRFEHVLLKLGAQRVNTQ